MKRFADVVREIRGTLASIIIFFIILDSTIVFLIVYLLLSILDLYPVSALIPALFYAGMSFYRETKLNKIRIVEKYYPELNEKLRTAADHATAENEVVDELHREVMAEVRNVSASSFFNRKETITKIASVVLLCFVIIFITSLNFNLGDYKGRLFDSIRDSLSDAGGGGEDTDLQGESLAGTGDNSDIYGQKSVAVLGDEDIEMQMRPSSYEFIIRESGELEEAEEFNSQLPPDITAVEARNYKEDIPEEKDKQQLIKNYFKKLAEG